MSNHLYRLILGILLLVSLYFDLRYVMYVLIAMLFAEGVTNWRVPLLVQKLRRNSAVFSEQEAEVASVQRAPRFQFEAERAWRLVIGMMLFVTYVLLYDTLWFIPWFMGFAILGAGVSRVCPVLISVKWMGFR
ncbi:MAG: hypothetical protein ACYC2R_07805 [Burkholderiales bacterium]